MSLDNLFQISDHSLLLEAVKGQIHVHIFFNSTQFRNRKDMDSFLFKEVPALGFKFKGRRFTNSVLEMTFAPKSDVSKVDKEAIEKLVLSKKSLWQDYEIYVS